jgi:hypothetical protein
METIIILRFLVIVWPLARVFCVYEATHPFYFAALTVLVVLKVPAAPPTRAVAEAPTNLAEVLATAMRTVAAAAGAAEPHMEGPMIAAHRLTSIPGADLQGTVGAVVADIPTLTEVVAEDTGEASVMKAFSMMGC